MHDNYHFCPACGAGLATSEIDGRARHVCARGCGFVHWNNPVPVAAALVIHEGDAILVRKAEWPGGWFGLVTGFIEQAEDPGDAARREVEEELGLQSISLERICEFAFGEQNQIILGFAVECSGTISLSSELSEYKRVPIDKLRPWPFGTGRVVAQWLSERCGA